MSDIANRTHNVLHVAVSLELLSCEESRLISRLEVPDPAGGAEDGPVEGQHSGPLEKLDLTQLHGLDIM